MKGIRDLPIRNRGVAYIRDRRSGAAIGGSEAGAAGEEIRHALHGRFSRKRAERQLDRAIDWGRYAELFDYDADAQHFVRL